MLNIYLELMNAGSFRGIIYGSWSEDLALIRLHLIRPRPCIKKMKNGNKKNVLLRYFNCHTIQPNHQI
jgi:hypothetical protein